ncbi:MAG TPA: helix-turn-helix domain-containing protein [Caulobacterales bacterium]|nr:helix-turn-helix domain-containing protein [Caulobacterales bacterium]
MEEQQAEAPAGKIPLLDGWLTRAEVAAEIGMSIDTLARWESRRVGPPCVRIGRKVLYRAQAFRDWLVARESPRDASRKNGGGR